jgi:hypothetical protein
MILPLVLTITAALLPTVFGQNGTIVGTNHYWQQRGAHDPSGVVNYGDNPGSFGPEVHPLGIYWGVYAHDSSSKIGYISSGFRGTNV